MEQKSKSSKLTASVTGFSESAKEKTERVDVMLQHLMRLKVQEWLRDGVMPERMTLDEIAEFCGVDRMVIQRTEAKALRKLRSKFQKMDLK